MIICIFYINFKIHIHTETSSSSWLVTNYYKLSNSYKSNEHNTNKMRMYQHQQIIRSDCVQLRAIGQHQTVTAILRTWAHVFLLHIEWNCIFGVWLSRISFHLIVLITFSSRQSDIEYHSVRNTCLFEKN